MGGGQGECGVGRDTHLRLLHFFFLSLLLSLAGDAPLLLIIHQPGSSNRGRSQGPALAAAPLPMPASRSRRAAIPGGMVPSAAGGGRLLL